jgi:ketosteroid isomerase-like protein
MSQHAFVRFAGASALGVVASLAFAQSQDTTKPPPPPTFKAPVKPMPVPAFSAEECAVWARELSFADSVAQHDAKAFAAHVHEGAVFSAKRPDPLRGRDAILEDWAHLIDGTAVKLWWYPTAVAIGGEGDIAYSSGPALYESTDPKEPRKHSIGGFQSVWHKDAGGTWRVLFDDGIAPRPANEADVAAFHAGRKPCPQRGA